MLVSDFIRIRVFMYEEQNVETVCEIAQIDARESDAGANETAKHVARRA